VRRRTRTAAGTFVAAALLLGGLAVPGLTAPAAAQSADGKVAGFGVAERSGEVDRLSVPTGRRELDRMRAAGGNTVMLDAMWFVEDRRSNTITPPDSLASDDQALVRAAQQAKAAGLNVMLTVKVECPGCANRWRGSLEPEDPEAFLVGSYDTASPAHGARGSYLYMSNHYAELASRMGAVTYFIGSEMASTQRYADYWRMIALETRQRYSGRVGYQVNWESMREVAFWDEVDIAGLSAYVPLTDALHPNVADLLKAWRSSKTQKPWTGVDWYAEIEALQRDTRSDAAPSGKPLLFGEVGYQSATQAAQRPWTQNKTDGYDPQLQADAYQAVLTVFQDRPWFLGAIWWEWLSIADEGDLGYSPRAKLAEQLLTRWYAGARPAKPGESLVGETRPSADGAPIPKETLEGPTSPSGRTSVSRPVAPIPAKPRSAAAAPSATAQQSTAGAPALPGTVAPASPTGAAPSVAAAPELPEVLARVQTGTVEDALARAAAREELRRTAWGAAALLAVSLMCHVAWVAPAAVRRVRRRRA
jgi:hypothetical protein